MHIETNILDKIDDSKLDAFLQNKNNNKSTSVKKKARRRVRPMASDGCDLVGNKLTIGDNVVFVASRDKNLVRGTITRFEPRMVILDLDGMYQRRAYKKVMKTEIKQNA